MSDESPTAGLASELIKMSPPVGVSGANFAGLPVDEWVLWVTLVYTAIMTAHKLLQLWRDLKNPPPPPCPLGRRKEDRQ